MFTEGAGGQDFSVVRQGPEQRQRQARLRSVVTNITPCSVPATQGFSGLFSILSMAFTSTHNGLQKGESRAEREQSSDRRFRLVWSRLFARDAKHLFSHGHEKDDSLMSPLGLDVVREVSQGSADVLGQG